MCSRRVFSLSVSQGKALIPPPPPVTEEQSGLRRCFIHLMRKTSTKPRAQPLFFFFLGQNATDFKLSRRFCYANILWSFNEKPGCVSSPGLENRGWEERRHQCAHRRRRRRRTHSKADTSQRHDNKAKSSHRRRTHHTCPSWSPVYIPRFIAHCYLATKGLTSILPPTQYLMMLLWGCWTFKLLLRTEQAGLMTLVTDGCFCFLFFVFFFTCSDLGAFHRFTHRK